MRILLNVCSHIVLVEPIFSFQPAGRADPSTPAFLIERASTPQQKVIRGTIADLPGRMAQESLDGPVLVLIGRALAGE
ncbi:hypothetical protein [Methylocystis heyeri]|uniref:hypothetical protein n=1 Tax=Methylocystis heyeri TaxID=391905 RepID=UPI0011396F78|nr:hypothetical protein [Methylocystis heyeri]